MSSNVIISADSTCDLSEELLRQYSIRTIPYHVEYRGCDHLDSVDITPEAIYEGFREDGSLPNTSAINVQEYASYFKSIGESGCEVVHLNLGGALSSSHDHACLAAQELEGVRVVDSCNLSTGIGQLAIRASRMAESGMSAGDIVVELERMKGRVHTSFVLEELEFMAAGGRCPQVFAHAGKTLRLRPEITVDTRDGSMHVGRLHHGSMRKALREYLREQVEKNPGILTDDVFVTHSGEVSQALLHETCSELHRLLPGLRRVHVTRASCTISSHCGPGTLGIIFVTEE